VPTIVDLPSGRVVTNDYRQISLDLSTQWSTPHGREASSS
jgi:glutathionyl-hydroquinone reductase